MTFRTVYSFVAALLVSLGNSVVGPAAATLLAAGAAAANEGAASQPEALDGLMAPIALYPDALVLQILECSSAPDQVKKLSDWIRKNPEVKGTAAQDAVTAEGFEASFVAIVLFPQVVQMMTDKPDWTRDVAKAFTSDRAGVFASIQRLREQAQAMGNLATNEAQQVETITTTDGQQVIVIQPANPQVVYVPQYNPTVVYTQPPPASNDTAAAGLVGFTVGIIIGAAIADDDDIYYGCGGWGYRGGLCNEGWEDYYDHREQMARDYYDHRENMAGQRGENQGQRQENRSDNQTGRQETRSENQTGRQETRGSGQAAPGQSPSTQGAGGRQASRGTATAAARGSSTGAKATPSQRAGTSSGAYSGYQRGSNEREASSRGRASTSKQSSGGSRGGRGRGGGGRGR